MEAELALGREDVLGPLDDLVARYPLREHLAALRMQALYRAGRQAEALAAYRGLRQTLDQELGIKPSAEVEAMHRRVLRQDPALVLRLRGHPRDRADRPHRHGGHSAARSIHRAGGGLSRHDDWRRVAGAG